MMNADSADAMAFVLLADADAGQVVHFTDNEWSGSGFNSGEGYFNWTVPGGDQLFGFLGTSESNPTFVLFAASTSSSFNVTGSGVSLGANTAVQFANSTDAVQYSGARSYATTSFTLSGNDNDSDIIASHSTTRRRRP